MSSKKAAKDAISSIGLGYDLASDLKLNFCKRHSSDSRLIAIDDDQVRDIQFPGGISIPNVPKSIKCDKGERMRLCSDVLSFQQMSEHFNQVLALSGKIPTGHFNAVFEFTQGWQKDAANTKSLAFDGISIILYDIALGKTQLVLRDYVKKAVPSSWDPAALARFIEKYGTHVTVGVKIGGTDIIYAKQQYSSPLQPADVQERMKDMADKSFIGEARPNHTNGGRFDEKEKVPNIPVQVWRIVSKLDMDVDNPLYIQFAKIFKEDERSFRNFSSSSYSHMEVQDIKFMCKRKGGNTTKHLSHSECCQTVQSEPDVISMSFIPITSLLSGISGSGYLTHAINLYLRYKPPVEELHQFLEFQLPRQWAPVFGELALGPERKPQNTASLQFSFMGPKLYVNTAPVEVGKKPVTGLRLYLEGKRSNCLAIHLQHLSSLPKTFKLEQEMNENISNTSSERKYYENVQWKSISHVCTAPIESDEDNSVVTGAQFVVGETGLKKVLFLRLHFSRVVGGINVKAPVWDGSASMTQKSGMISTFISTRFSTAQKPPPKPSDVNVNSAIYPGGPPVPTQTPKLLRFVDTTEMTRGPQDSPGYWVVSGARLLVDKAKISLKVKYSLLAIMPEDEVARF